jgi:hypothetical protein
MEKIARVSLLIRLLLGLVACLNVVAITVSIMTQSSENTAELAFGTSQSSISQAASLPKLSEDFAKELDSSGLNSHAIMLLPELFFSLFIYLSLIKLFGLYQQGGIFTVNHINQLRNIGSCLLVWPVFDLLYPSLIAVIFRIFGLSPSLLLVFSIDTDQLITLLIGLIIFVMSWIMMEGVRLQQEQELTI